MITGSHYSIVRFVGNPFSNDSIALGLVVLCPKITFLRFSEQKIAIAKKLHPDISNLLNLTIKQFQKFINKDLDISLNELIRFDKQIDIDYLNRLSIYSNGIIQFSKPSFVKLNFDESVFDDFFNKFIRNEIELQNKHNQSSLSISVESKFYAPLRDKIDVDYTLKKSQLPTLFFDYHLDGLGLNGSMYAAKAVDFNTKHRQ